VEIATQLKRLNITESTSLGFVDEGRIEQRGASGGSLDSAVRLAEVESKELILRSYQLELAERAMARENCIVVAPTGSGKTHVALQIAKDHFEKSAFGDDPKVKF